MQIDVTVTVPKLIYDIYANAAETLGNCSTAQVMSGALQAYAQFLFEEMQANGELSDDETKARSV